MAAYAVVCYLMSIKDRHNGNILLDRAGHFIHIDFGFMLSNTPGNINFEKAGFKFTREMATILGGTSSKLFQQFRALCVEGYLAARLHSRQVMMLVEITRAAQPDLPCFTARTVLQDMAARFQLGLTKAEAAQHFEAIIDDALDNWYTRQYDKYQFLTNGILE